MSNFSSLLLANHSVVDELVKVVYDDSEIVEDDKGEKRLLFIKYYRKRKVYFDDRGMLLLYRAAIAFFLGMNKSNVNKSIKRIEESGFFDRYPGAVVQCTTIIHGQIRPTLFYNSLVISIIASRLIKPTQEASDFLVLHHNSI